MKRIFLCVLFSFLIIALSAQITDIIITKKDTIFCTQYVPGYYRVDYITSDGVEGMIKPDKMLYHILSPQLIIESNEYDEFLNINFETTEMFNFGSAICPFSDSFVDLKMFVIKNTTLTDTAYYIYVRTPCELGCAGAVGNKLIVLFKDKTRLFISEENKNANCDRTATSIYKIEGTNYLALSTKEIKGIRFIKSKGHVDYYTFFPDVLINVFDLLKPPIKNTYFGDE